MIAEEKVPIIRRKPSVKSFVEELKFLKSFKDVGYFAQKASYVFPRLTGNVARFTEVPPSIQIEPTLFCNAACITCCHSKTTRKKGSMDWDLFTKIIDDASQIGVKRAQLFVYGEPLIHPKIVDMIRYVKSRNMGFHLTTNGSLLSGKIAEGILTAGVNSLDYLTVSILGYSAEVHEKVMLGLKHGVVVQNVHNFMDMRKKLGVNGPIVETVFYGCKENVHELPQFLEYWSKVVDHAINGGSAVEAFVDQNQPHIRRTKTCAQLWERMAVHWNGDVASCGEDLNGVNVMGNLREQSIMEVWNGEKMRAFKQKHKDGKFEGLCEHCDW